MTEAAPSGTVGDCLKVLDKGEKDISVFHCVSV